MDSTCPLHLAWMLWRWVSMWYHIAATTSAVPTRKMRKYVHGRRSPRLAGAADACPSGSWTAPFTGAGVSPRLVMNAAGRRLQKAQLLRWRPPPRAQRTASTPRVQPSGAASHLDLFEPPASFLAYPPETFPSRGVPASIRETRAPRQALDQTGLAPRQE